MSCCGGGARRPPDPVIVQRVNSMASAARMPRVVFRYEGDRPVVVVGRVTGAKYRFERGAEVEVDLRDRPSVMLVPRLREMRRG